LISEKSRMGFFAAVQLAEADIVATSSPIRRCGLRKVVLATMART